MATMSGGTPQSSNFGFVGVVWPNLLNDCRLVERSALTNPCGSLFQARFVLESVVGHVATVLGIPNTDRVIDAMVHPDFASQFPDDLLKRCMSSAKQVTPLRMTPSPFHRNKRNVLSDISSMCLCG
ncbi:hypothetical protein [Corynebacterium striatum]|uniref:Uncharacterized protein n=1 Tax=Corynebacterium striatum TaxID=43770 RepID=A0ABX7DGR2_CORST|nr:hypothetical protein [Corynebacterium striatum]EGT5613610.1 hypothetical protein [Corynebacterium striatum]MDC7105878.1 hypothetical protein [Corynebacterium striatum]QQU77896.1 hypothetical protein I6I72_05015 [Corynebacterium striatum]VFB08068.1 type I restriction-modification system, restriction subunit [Corynebacterium striatum]HAT1213447.1 hypothetical protein [Corynebacterium striatum]